jgi:uncharacterized protein
MHFAVPAERVAARLPSGLELDPEVADATVSLVALGAVGPAPRLVERSPLAKLIRYDQLNLRTYVKGPKGRGIFIFDTRVDTLWPTVARVAGWPYHRDAELAYTAEAHAVALKARGVDVKGLPAPDLPAEVEKDAREHTLLHRYLSYGESPAGLLYVVRVGHRPWRVRNVEVDPEFRVELGDLGIADLGSGRLISAQLAESVDVTIDEVMPATKPSSLFGRIFSSASLRLVRSTP